MKLSTWVLKYKNGDNKPIEYIRKEDILNELELEINDGDMKDLSPIEQARVETLKEVVGWIK